MKIFYSSFLLVISTITVSPLFAQNLDHWETVVYNDQVWTYTLGDSEPPTNWNEISFNDSGWSAGAGGIGYGDDDDNTEINSTLSLYMRRVFDFSDLSKIEMILMHADYDDAFVAYLNGVEIARRFIGSTGVNPTHNQSADGFHEASMPSGGSPDVLLIDKNIFDAVAVEGQNVLAIQVHNENVNSSDMSSNFWLSVALNDASSVYGPTPDWFFSPYFSSNIPLVFIETLETDEIYDEPKVPAHMGIIDNGPGNLNNYNDSYNGYDGFISIEIRGASSQSFPKKNYGFETQDAAGENNNVSLLGMPEENDWILHGPFPDKSLMRNVLAYHMGRLTGRYAPRTRHCELIINGDYRGVYVLTERIKRDANRVDIAKLKPEDISGDELTGGYILQIDRDDDSVDDDGWYSEYPDYKFFAYNYPDYDDIVPEQAAYIRNYMDTFEEAMDAPDYLQTYRDYVNVSSWVDYFLVTEVGKHIDAFKLSFYMHKKKASNGGKLHFGPLWDFNLGFGNFDFACPPDPEGWSYLFGDDCSPWLPFWSKKMTDIPQVSHQINCRWEELRSGPLKTDSLIQFIDEQVAILEAPSTRNFERWNILGEYVWPNSYIGNTYEEEVSFLKAWLIQRLDWMDSNMIGDCEQYEPTNTEELAFGFKVYPNPATSHLVVESMGLTNATASFELIDLLGESVRRFDLMDGEKLVSLENLAAGMYFYRILNKGIVLRSGKINVID